MWNLRIFCLIIFKSFKDNFGFQLGKQELTMEEHTQQKDKITWGDLKTVLERSGIRDCDEIDHIELGWGSPDQIHVEHDDVYGWQVYQKTTCS